MRMRRSTRRVLLAAMSIALVLLPLEAGPAGAAVGDTATVTSSVQPLPGVAPVTVSCVLHVGAPAQAGVVVSVVNVSATWTCSAPITTLSLQVSLLANGLPVAQGSGTSVGVPAAAASATTACLPGTYAATATGTVQFLPGFSPPAGTALVASTTLLITCA